MGLLQPLHFQPQATGGQLGAVKLLGVVSHHGSPLANLVADPLDHLAGRQRLAKHALGRADLEG